jgi:hypothetical protein
MVADLSQLVVAIERQRGGTAAFVQSGPVKETHGGQPSWEGIVRIFDLAGHPTATSPIEGGDKHRFFAVLHQSRIKSRADAGRAAIVA